MAKKMRSKGKKHTSYMIQEDLSAPALLPRHVIEKEWTSPNSANMGYITDLFEGVTKSMNQDISDLKKCKKPNRR
jgi:hypothetical protein